MSHESKHRVLYYIELMICFDDCTYCLLYRLKTINPLLSWANTTMSDKSVYQINHSHCYKIASQH